MKLAGNADHLIRVNAVVRTGKLFGWHRTRNHDGLHLAYDVASQPGVTMSVSY
jgi:hypothetical protein